MTISASPISRRPISAPPESSGGPVYVSAAFSITSAASLVPVGESINADNFALSAAGTFIGNGAAIAASSVEIQGTSVIEFQGDAVSGGTVAAAAFEIAATAVFEANGAQISASTFDSLVASDLQFEGYAIPGNTIVSAEFGITAQAALTFQGDGGQANTVVTLGAKPWRKPKDDAEEEAELIALMEQIIPIAVAHRTGLQVRR